MPADQSLSRFIWTATPGYNSVDSKRITRKGTLTQKDLNIPPGGAVGGHAVVLVRCDETSLTFMNSWGPAFGSNGFFSIDKASTLELTGGQRMQFFDVYWTTDDLSIYPLMK